MQPGEILHVGPYKVQLIEVFENGMVAVRAIFQPNQLQKQATTQLIPTEKYLELRQLAAVWQELSTQERVAAVFEQGFNPVAEIRR